MTVAEAVGLAVGAAPEPAGAEAAWAESPRAERRSALDAADESALEPALEGLLRTVSAGVVVVLVVVVLVVVVLVRPQGILGVRERIG